MATATRKKKTAADSKKELEAARRKVAALEAKAYESELAEAIAASNIVSEFEKKKYTDIAAVNILLAIGKAVKIPRVGCASVTRPSPISC